MEEENRYRYKAITSDGEIYFDLKDEIGKVLESTGWYFPEEEIKFNNDDITQKFIQNSKFHTFGITYSAESKRYFLTKEVNYCGREYDDSYTLEYLILSKEEWGERN